MTLIALLSALALCLAACGNLSSSSSASAGSAPTGAGGTATTTSTTEFAKTKFVFHAGLAFGAFHHWIYEPAKAGELSHPLAHPLVAAKAAIAAAFVYHELKLALADAQADPKLSKIVAPITALENKIHDLSGSVKSGGTSAAAAATGLDGEISSIKGQAASAGQAITEQTPPSPSG